MEKVCPQANLQINDFKTYPEQTKFDTYHPHFRP